MHGGKQSLKRLSPFAFAQCRREQGEETWAVAPAVGGQKVGSTSGSVREHTEHPTQPSKPRALL